MPDTGDVASGQARRSAGELDQPREQRLVELGDLAVEPKQAWTPVAQFAELGLVAVNFGPGSPRFAHRVDEQVEIAALERSFDTLRRLVSQA